MKKPKIIQILFLLFFFVILPLCYLRRTVDPLITFRLFFLTVSLIIIYSAVLIKVLTKSKFNYANFCKVLFSQNSSLIISFTGVLLISCIAHFFALNKAESLYSIIRDVAFFLFFLASLFFLSVNRDFFRTASKAILLTSLIISLTGFFQYVFRWFYFIPGHEVIFSFFANRNLFASALFLSLPFLIYLYFLERTGWKILVLITITISFFNIVSAKTRAVWLAVITGALLVLIVSNLFRSRSKTEHVKTKIHIKILIVLIIIAILSGFLIAKLPIIQERNQPLFEKSLTSTGNFLVRYHAWLNTIKMISDHPLLGVGPGNWKIIFPQYGILGMKVESGAYQYMRPHNDFLWVAAESGLIGMFFYILIFGVAIKYSIFILIKANSFQDRIFALTMLFGISGYIVIANFSFPKERIFHSLLILFQLAAVSVYYNKFVKKNNHPYKSRWKLLNLVLVFLILLSLILSVYSYFRLKSEVHFYHAYLARIKNDFITTIAAISRTDPFILNISPTGIPLTWYRGNAYFQINKIEAAFEDFKTAYKNHPNFIYVLNNLATCYEIKNNPQKAIMLYNKVLDISPYFRESLLNLSAIYYNQGKYLDAYKIIHKVRTTDANYRTSYFKRKIRERLELESNQMESINE